MSRGARLVTMMAVVTWALVAVADCPGDLNGDGKVMIDDILLEVTAALESTCVAPAHCDCCGVVIPCPPPGGHAFCDLVDANGDPISCTAVCTGCIP